MICRLYAQVDIVWLSSCVFPNFQFGKKEAGSIINLTLQVDEASNSFLCIFELTFWSVRILYDMHTKWSPNEQRNSFCLNFIFYCMYSYSLIDCDVKVIEWNVCKTYQIRLMIETRSCQYLSVLFLLRLRRNWVSNPYWLLWNTSKWTFR